MAKDPGFIFYPDNFLGGTLFFSNEQCGIYIKLLCAQYIHGHMSEEEMIKTVGVKDDKVWSKFLTDDEGKLYNQRLEDEMEKRGNFSKKQSENIAKRWADKNSGINQNNTKPIPNNTKYKNSGINQNNTRAYEIEIEYEIGIEIEFDVFKKYRVEIKKPIRHASESAAFKNLVELCENNTANARAIIQQSIANSWTGLFELKKTKHDVKPVNIIAEAVKKCKDGNYGPDKLPVPLLIDVFKSLPFSIRKQCARTTGELAHGAEMSLTQERKQAVINFLTNQINQQ